MDKQLRTHYDRQEAMKIRKYEGWGVVQKARQPSEFSAFQGSGVALSTSLMLFNKSSQRSEAGIIPVNLERTDLRPMRI